MILPDKHVRLSNSLISLGATLLKNMTNEQTVTLLWTKTRLLPDVKTFERFTLGIDLLYVLGLIDFREGLLRRLQ
jgi:hypothetical protein